MSQYRDDLAKTYLNRTYPFLGTEEEKLTRAFKTGFDSAVIRAGILQEVLETIEKCPKINCTPCNTLIAETLKMLKGDTPIS